MDHDAATAAGSPDNAVVAASASSVAGSSMLAAT